MSKRSLTLLALGVLALPLLAAGRGPGQERYLKDTDLRKVAGALQDYLDAKDEGKGVNEAEADLLDEMEKLEKKLEDTPAAGNLLASPGDLGHAMWLSFDYYGKKNTVKSGKIEKAEFYDGQDFTKKDPLEFAVWTPGKYRPRTDAYPLILTIADSGVEPFDHLTERWPDASLREAAILACPTMPEDTTLWEERDGLARVMYLYREITNHYAVDFDRIYLAGRGRGVKTAVDIAATFPDRFAGVIGRAGDVGNTPADNFGNLPCFFAGGGAKVTAFAEAAEALGRSNVTLQADGLEADIWNWIQANPRNSYPTEIALIATPNTNRMYWLQVPRTDGSTPVRVTAKADRATNTITVEGDGVNEFTLHFSDAVIDLSKEVTVLANGQEYKDKIDRSFKETLRNIYFAANDPGKILVASKQYHLPSVKRDGGGK